MNQEDNIDGVFTTRDMPKDSETMAKNRVVIRACMTNYNTSERDADRLLDELNATFIELQLI